MFEVGEIVVCVDVKPHSYGAYWDSKKTSKQKKGTSTITIGKRYDVIESDKHNTTVRNDKGIPKSYRTDRFKSITKDRRTKIIKLRSKIKKTCSKSEI
jgi:hypothetical protein